VKNSKILLETVEKKHSRNFSRIFLIRNDFDDTTIGYDTDDESKVFIIIISAQK